MRILMCWSMGRSAPAAVTVRVCESLSCAMAGSERLYDELKDGVGPGVRVVRGPCMGRCDRAPAAMVGQVALGEATVSAVGRVLAKGKFEPVIPHYVDIDRYVADGGYRVLEACKGGRLSAGDLIEKLDKSGLRGLGGAGFRSAQKWRLVSAQPGPRLMAVNADEGEPGTFKDRYYLETDPHRFLEGMLLAAWAVEAESSLYLPAG